METDSDYVGCALNRKSTMCWTQGMRRLSDAASELRAAVRGRSVLLDAKSMMIDFGETRAEERKGEHSTADIDMKAMTAALLRIHSKRSRWNVAMHVLHERYVQWFGHDGWSRGCELASEFGNLGSCESCKADGCQPCNEVASVIYLSQDTRNNKFLWWDDLDTSCNETMDAK